jgi:HK97 family phage major capsid protein
MGKASHIDFWPIADASLTHTPAEPRNTIQPIKSVIPLKSLSELLPPFPEQPKDEPEAELPAASDGETEAKARLTPESKMEVAMATGEEIKTITMTEEELKAIVQGAVKDGSEAALKALPPRDDPQVTGEVKVVIDEADRPFKTMAEMCKAVKDDVLSLGRNQDVRLKRLDVKAAPTGANEWIPSDGGYLLEPEISTALIQPMRTNGDVAQYVTPVRTNRADGWINGIDETDRTVGNRWGGIRGYRLGEGDTITASKPKFRRITWSLKKYAVLVYATDELLADQSQFEAIVRQGAGEELAFMLGDDIMNGLGATGPYGVVGHSGTVNVTAETGQGSSTVVYENLVKMWARMHPKHQRDAIWFVNVDVNPQLDILSLPSGTAALEPRFIGYDNQGVMRIKGRPVVASEFCQTLGTSGDIVLFSPSGYALWEHASGVQSASSIHVQFLTDQMVFRFTYRCDGQPIYASALTPYKGSNTLAAFVTLNSTRT